MTWKTRFLGLALGAMSGALMAQQATSSQSTTTTTTTRTVTGSVVQYTPGQSIVIRSADGKMTTYMLGSSLPVPAEVQVGRSVTLSTEPGSSGSQTTVTRIEVKNANPADSSAPAGSSAPSAWSGSPSGAAGQFSSSTTTTTTGSSASSPSASSDQDASSVRPSSGASSAVPPSSGLSSGTSQSQTTQTTQTTTSISGKVTAYQPKQSITLDEPGKGSVTYVIDAQSTLPQDVAVGKTVTITTRTVEGSSKPVVRSVTTTTTTKTTETHPQ